MKTIVTDPKSYLFGIISFVTMSAKANVEPTPLEGHVYAQVLTSNKKPTDLAVVSLIRSGDSGLVEMKYSSRTGLTELEHVEAGTYMLKVSQSGYRTQFSAPFTLSEAQSTVVVPAMILGSADEKVKMAKPELKIN